MREFDVRLGVGMWAWGDKHVWGYGHGYSAHDLNEAFAESTAAGILFFDTAEIYGWGMSERLLGGFMRVSRTDVLVASKFFPFPWRLTRGSIIRALRRSLQRLGAASVYLYQIHWPFHLLSIPTVADALREAVERGLTQRVGVSNYSIGQMQRMQDALGRAGIPLTSNQVEFSLLQRKPERTGLLAACKELGIALIAYSPLAMGMLTGKYGPESLPAGLRKSRYRKTDFKRLERLLAAMREIGKSHEGKTPAQVALNWLMRKGAIPIPGAKNAQQARENAGALEWSLTEEEVATLDDLSEIPFLHNP